MSKNYLKDIALIYESSINEHIYLIEYVGGGNKIHSMEIPESLNEYDRNSGVYMFQRFRSGNDRSVEDNRKFSIQVYDDNEIKYLRDDENAGTWLDSPGDLPKLLNNVATFGFTFDQLVSDYFPRMTERDYKWLLSLKRTYHF